MSISKWNMPDDQSDDEEIRPAPPPLQSLRVQVQSFEFPPPPPPIAAPEVTNETPVEPIYSKPNHSGTSKQGPGHKAAVQPSKKWDIPSDSDSDAEPKRPKVPLKSQDLTIDGADDASSPSKGNVPNGHDEVSLAGESALDDSAYETITPPPVSPPPAVQVEEEVHEIVPDDPEESGILKTVIQTQTVTEMVESRVPDFDGEDYAQYLQDDDHFVNFVFTLGRKKEKTTETLGRKREPNDFAFIENPFAQEVQYKTVPVQKKTIKQTVTTLMRKDKTLDGNHMRSIADYATLSRSLQNFAYADSKMGSTMGDEDDDDDGGRSGGGASELGLSTGGGGGGGGGYRGGTMPAKQRLGYGSVVSMDQLAAQCRAAEPTATSSRQRFQKAKRGQHPPQRASSDAGYDRRNIYESVDDARAGGGGAAPQPPIQSPGAGSAGRSAPATLSTSAAAAGQQKPTKESGKKGKSLFKGLKKFFGRSKTVDGSTKRGDRAGGEEEEDYQEFAPF